MSMRRAPSAPAAVHKRPASANPRQNPVCGRPLYSFTDYEMSILRDWQLGSYGHDGIGRNRTLPPSYVASLDWSKGRDSKPPPDFTEIPGRRRGLNKSLSAREQHAPKARTAASDLNATEVSNASTADARYDYVPWREKYLCEEEEPRARAPQKFRRSDFARTAVCRWDREADCIVNSALITPEKRRPLAGLAADMSPGRTIMLVHKEKGDDWLRIDSPGSRKQKWR